jgi:site-specific recombinase XerD
VTAIALPSAEPNARRAEKLDALAGILPMERRDQLAAILTDDDVETLRHLAREGMGENSLRALASDLAYLEAWSFFSTGFCLPWPAPEGLVLKFVAHHLWDPARRADDSAHGMPIDVETMLRAGDHLRAEGPHASSTVKRRLAHWATLHRWKGLESPLGTPAIRTSVRLAVRASAKPRQRKSKRAVTRDILDRLIATCQTDRLADTRDLAILLVAFASGGRRRSEVARLRLEQLSDEPDVLLDPDDKNSPHLPCLAIALGRTKNTQADDDARVLLIGAPVAALREWIERADVKRGAVFRAIDQWEAISDRALAPQAINLILKRRCAMAGLDPVDFSAHGLRSGYLTEAGRNGVALPAAMRQSQHRSVQQAARYYNDADQAMSKAARLAI